MSATAEQDSPPRIVVRRDGHIGTVTFSNPRRYNAMTYEMWRDVPGAVRALSDDPDIRVVVFTGDGGKAFVSGADISQFEAMRADADARAAYDQALDDAYAAMLECPKPTVARITGICMGGGLGMSLNCDLRICTDDSTFRMPAGRLGLGYALEGIQRMVAVIGPANAADLFYTARKFDAAHALRIGFVNFCHPRAEFDVAFERYVAGIAENAPLTLRAAKQAFRVLAQDPTRRDLSTFQAAFEACFRSEDYLEGRRAFLEKREPRFKGR
jgi:enoyl-CoA hydratase